MISSTLINLRAYGNEIVLLSVFEQSKVVFLLVQQVYVVKFMFLIKVNEICTKVNKCL